ncbi:MAG: HEAT repeat domain-containing protein, partial [Ktedonobacterales bacterium]
MPTWPNRPTDWYLTALAHEDSRTRRQAAAALEVLADPRAVEPLITLLRKDEHREVRANAARALGKLGDQRATLPLIQALQDPAWEVRSSAVCALERLDDPQAVLPLIAALQDRKGDVAYHAMRVLGKLKDPRAVSPLVKMLQEDDRYLGPSLSAALSQLGEAAFEPLVEALKHGNSEARAQAALALAGLKDRRAISPLQEALSDADERVRVYVKRALEQFETSEMLERIKRQQAAGTFNVLEFLTDRL